MTTLVHWLSTRVPTRRSSRGRGCGWRNPLRRNRCLAGRQVLADFPDLGLNQMVVVERPFGRRHDAPAMPDLFGARTIGRQQHGGVARRRRWSAGTRGGRSVTGCASARLIACCSSRSMPSSPCRCRVVPREGSCRRYRRGAPGPRSPSGLEETAGRRPDRRRLACPGPFSQNGNGRCSLPIVPPSGAVSSQGACREREQDAERESGGDANQDQHARSPSDAGKA